MDLQSATHAEPLADAPIPLEQPWADRWLQLIDARFGERLSRDAHKSPMAITHDLNALLLDGLIEVPETNVVRTTAFKVFEPKPPPRPSAAEDALLARVLADRAPHLVGVVDRVREGERIPQDEQLEVTEALMAEVRRSGLSKRGLTAEGEAIFNLPHLFEPRE